MRITTRNANPRARFVERFSGTRWGLAKSGLIAGITSVSVSANMGDYDRIAYQVSFTINDDPAMLDKLIESLKQLRVSQAMRESTDDPVGKPADIEVTP